MHCRNEIITDYNNKSRNRLSVYLQADTWRSKRNKPSKVFADMETMWNFYHYIFNLLRDYGCIVGLANQSCVRGSLCLDSTALHCVARINFFHNSFRFSSCPILFISRLQWYTGLAFSSIIKLVSHWAIWQSSSLISSTQKHSMPLNFIVYFVEPCRNYSHATLDGLKTIFYVISMMNYYNHLWNIK